MLKIRNWGKWQTFRKDRGAPPWIKLHRCLMTNPDWAMLSDAEKGQLVSLWIASADKNGALPTSNAKILQKIAQLDGKPNIRKFIDLGFMTTTCPQDDNQMTTTCQPDDAPEESRVEQRRADFAQTSFECFWQTYPKKKDKQKSRKWWEKNITEDLYKEIMGGLQEQIKTHDWKKDNGKFIPYPTTWLNNARWEDEEVPEPEKDEHEELFGSDFSDNFTEEDYEAQFEGAI